MGGYKDVAPDGAPERGSATRSGFASLGVFGFPGDVKRMPSAGGSAGKTGEVEKVACEVANGYPVFLTQLS